MYLDNRYLQYANALCAALEVAAAPHFNDAPFQTLPVGFLDALHNEMNPMTAVAADLYPLKQRGQNSPHYEFPLRAGIEKSFEVQYRRGSFERSLGTLSYPQLLREAYPGAIYYYLAQPYRVNELRYATGRLRVTPTQHFTTQPRLQSMVFPKFSGGILQCQRAPGGFLAEVELQVSERVTGFVERRGRQQIEYSYAPGSSYAQRPIQRFFETTGVCWYPPEQLASGEAVAQALLNAFCIRYGVQHRDLGAGAFHANTSPLGPEPIQGMCIYDATHGSLRLTQRLVERFTEVLELALTLVRESEQPDAALEQDLKALHLWGATLSPTAALAAAPMPSLDEGWIALIAADQPAMLRHGSGETEPVTVQGYRYTPQGLLYVLAHSQPQTLWQVAAEMVIPVHGVTAMEQVNLMTGACRPLPVVSSTLASDSDQDTIESAATRKPVGRSLASRRAPTCKSAVQLPKTLVMAG